MKAPARLAALLTSCTLALNSIGCGAGAANTVASRPPPPPPKPICAVLSIGAEKGIAHIGVLDAMKAHGLAPSCVFGNSMGALVGGLYAFAPNYDLRTQYRAVMHEYVRATKQEAGDAGFLSAILLGGLVIASGGAAATALGVGALGGAAAAGSINPKSRARLVKVLDTHMGHADIASLPIQYGTWFEGFEPGPTIVPMIHGNLAGAIGSSVANPLIFPDVKVHPGARLDPGADRMAAVPLEDACKLRPDAHFMVSNVTGRPVYFSAQMRCSYTVVDVQTPSVDPTEVITGRGPDFDHMIWAGYVAALKALR